MAARYTHYYPEFGRQVMTAAYMEAIMRARATAVLAAAQAIAPVDTGDYVNGLEVSSGIRNGRTRRAYGRVTATANHSIAVEYGWGPTPKYRVLGKALGAAGGSPAPA